MKINIYNYEDFLLLYVDGELNANEMQLVEDFVNKHPHIQAELQAIQETKLVPEDFSFGNKEALFKTELLEGITTTNYEEKLLLYVDDELTNEEKSKVEKFVLHHPTIQQEFTTLKQSKLLPENLIYPNKEELYRKENKRAAIFYIFRAAVAAVFIGFISLAYLLLNQKEDVVNNGSVVANPSTNKGETKNLPIKVQINSSTTIIPQQKVAVNNAVVSINNSQQNQKIRATGVEPKNNVSIPVVQNNVVVNNNSPVIITPKKQEEIAIINSASINNQVNTTINANTVSTPINANTLVANNTESSIANTAFVPTVYKNLDIENEESNSILVGNMRLNKTKVKNLFNKVGKIFGKSKKAQLDEEETTPKAATTI